MHNKQTSICRFSGRQEVISVNVLRLQVMASENRFKWFVIVLYHKKSDFRHPKKSVIASFSICAYFCWTAASALEAYAIYLKVLNNSKKGKCFGSVFLLLHRHNGSNLLWIGYFFSLGKYLSHILTLLIVLFTSPLCKFQIAFLCMINTAQSLVMLFING